MNSDNVLEDFNNTMKSIQKSGVMEMGKGQCKKIVCPQCGGNALAASNIENGHIHIRCSNCSFCLMM